MEEKVDCRAQARREPCLAERRSSGSVISSSVPSPLVNPPPRTGEIGRRRSYRVQSSIFRTYVPKRASTGTQSDTHPTLP